MTVYHEFIRGGSRADKLHVMKMKKTSENETTLKTDPNKKFTW